MAKRLNVELAFTADIAQAKANIANLQAKLQQLSTSGASGSLGINKEIQEATQKATQLKAILASSTNDKGVLNLGKFNQGLKDSGLKKVKIKRDYDINTVFEGYCLYIEW